MKIVYTVNGEGMGHASRSGVVIEHLLSKGHEVFIFTAGERPVRYLREKYGRVAKVLGLHMVYRDNKIRRLRTALRVLMNLTELRADFVTMRKELGSFTPDVVITDFDFHGPILARQYQVPLISIDNIQFITQAKFAVAAEDMVDYELNYLVAKMMVPKADYYFITTLADAKVRDQKKSACVFFVPPLLREKIVHARPTAEDHFVVYQTSDSYRELVQVLSQTDAKFIVYNSRSGKAAPNITFKDFSEDSFIADLASARGVITNGGFTVISESIYLRKPVLSVPIGNYFEQKLNGMILQEKQCGMMVKRLSRTTLRQFVGRHREFAEAAGRLSFDNAQLFSKLDSILASLK